MLVLKTLIRSTTVVLLLLAFTTTAKASRSATASEQVAIAQAVGVPAECAEIKVASAGAWAVFTGANKTGCPEGNGIIALHLDEAIWKVLYMAADEPPGPCPMKGAAKSIPTTVGADLDLCLPQSRKVYVTDLSEDGLAIKPRLLPQGAHGAFEHLRWSKWGNKEASGRGRFDYGDLYTRFNVPIRIRLYRVRVCDNGTRIFTRRRVTAVKRSDRSKIRFESSRTKYGARC